MKSGSYLTIKNAAIEEASTSSPPYFSQHFNDTLQWYTKQQLVINTQKQEVFVYGDQKIPNVWGQQQTLDSAEGQSPL